MLCNANIAGSQQCRIRSWRSLRALRACSSRGVSDYLGRAVPQLFAADKRRHGEIHTFVSSKNDACQLRASDNAVSAVSRMIVSQPDAMPISQVRRPFCPRPISYRIFIILAPYCTTTQCQSLPLTPRSYRCSSVRCLCGATLRSTWQCCGALLLSPPTAQPWFVNELSFNLSIRFP